MTGKLNYCVFEVKEKVIVKKEKVMKLSKIL